MARVLSDCLPEAGNRSFLVPALGVLVSSQRARVKGSIVSRDCVLKVAQGSRVVAPQAEEVAACDPGLRGASVDLAQLLGQQQQVSLRTQKANDDGTAIASRSEANGKPELKPQWRTFSFALWRRQSRAAPAAAASRISRAS